MSEDEIAQIIRHIQQLNLRQERLLRLLEEAHTTAWTRASRHDATPGDRTPSRDDATFGARSSSVPPPATPRVASSIFNEGDRIVISNNVRKPKNRPLNSGDYTGVVLYVCPNQVHIRTTNGTDTWRAPKNLRHRKHHE
jgi:hypothetical protein